MIDLAILFLCIFCSHCISLVFKKVFLSKTNQQTHVEKDKEKPAPAAPVAHKDWRDGLHGINTKLGYLLDSGDKSDVILNVEDGRELVKIKAHKFVLSCASAYFDVLFFGSMSSNQPEYTIIEEYSKSFLNMIKLLYYGDYDIPTLEVGIELYILADKYLCSDAVIHCGNFLQKNINVQNIGIIYNLACTYKNIELQSQCRTFWCDNTKEILSGKTLHEITLENAVELFYENSMWIDNELQLFTAIKNNHSWCKGDSKIFLRLLKSIHYLSMRPDDFAQVVNSKLLPDEYCLAITTRFAFSAGSVKPLPDGFSDSKISRTR